jgi:hypothetical protein
VHGARHAACRELRAESPLDELLPQGAHDDVFLLIVGITEDNDVFFLQTKESVFTIHLKSMQCKDIFEMSYVCACHSFTSVYTAGNFLLPH